MQDEHKVNVLLVDDHPENLLVLEAVLGDLGQNLVKAQSGEEALRCLLNQDFAVILLDVQMPDMDGFETATLIRQRERSRNTPIIFLTAFSTSDTLMFKGYSLGAVDYLLKPIDPVILASKVSVFVDLFKKNLEIKRQATQMAAMNANLRQSEERFRTLSACSPVGIFLLDIEGQCTYTNPQCQAICGFTLEESLGDGWIRFLHPQDQERAIADWLATIRSQDTFSYEYRFQVADGDRRWAHVRTAPMFADNGSLIGYVGTLEDITERKQAELIREQVVREQTARQQAETANRMKDEFLAIVSHELRTPLNSILGWSHLLQNKQLDAATTTRALETIERNARSQARLIDDVLDISRIVRGKLQLSLIPINLGTVLETALEVMQPLADEKNIHLDTALEPAPQMVMGDPERLRQIIWNLLSNAIKFTPEGGKVEVWLESIAENTAVPYARLSIIDTGIGIVPDFLPHVFDRFRQADSSSTRAHGGLGLGLAIVHYLVELHHGTITAHSEGENKGATFTVTLPLLSPVAGRQPEGKLLSRSPQTCPPGAAETLCGVHALLVEDDGDARDFLKMTLEQFGAEVTAVASANDALTCLQHIQPTILVSDISMPESDGYQLIHSIRSVESVAKRLPAIALTAHTRLEDRMDAIAAGFQAHVSKPVEPDQLVSIIVQLLKPAIATLSD